MLGKWKWIIPSILIVWLLVNYLLPDKKGMLMIVATPYIVESGDSIMKSISDESGKLFKLNKILDKKLDLLLDQLDNTISSEIGDSNADEK